MSLLKTCALGLWHSEAKAEWTVISVLCLFGDAESAQRALLVRHTMSQYPIAQLSVYVAKLSAARHRKYITWWGL